MMNDTSELEWVSNVFTKGAKWSLNVWKQLQLRPMGLDDYFGMFWDLQVVNSLPRDYNANFPLFKASKQHKNTHTHIIKKRKKERRKGK